MPNSDDQSPSDDYFNDLSQQPGASTRAGGGESDHGGPDDTANGGVPKPKRIACVLCRKRKLRCDGNKPSCGTCTRLQHDCSYDEVRRKSGPKRGYVKALEARLAQVETLLKTQDDQPTSGRNKSGNANGMVPEYQDVNLIQRNTSISVLPHNEAIYATQNPGAKQQNQYAQNISSATANGNVSVEEPFPWEMIGLGLDEPLPNMDVVNELNEIYFDKVHPSLPMMHRPRYYAAMNLAPHMRPPVCLRYAMWCNAATVTDKYEQLHEHFYLRARKYIQQDEMRGHGESMITVAHCQAWILLATYEFKLMYFPRAWMSSGRGSRMAQMMGLHRLDGAGLDVKQCLPPPRDWTEREERRRTFWMAFCVDRYSSIGTGWPMTIEEKDIMSALPGDEESYELSRQGKNMTLEEALSPDGTPNISGYGGVILMACLFGRNLTHLHRPSPDDADDDLNGEFWKRHRGMDNILLNTALSLPDPLRLPTGLNDPNIVFLNMCIHTSTICLHQAAIFKADKNRMPARISAESKVRCITAAAEIASIMRTISHLDISGMNPFISFCLYVAARVFVQYLKSRPKDTQIKTSLQFLLQAMTAIKRKNPLTESFLVQLDVDLEGAGLDTSIKMPQIPNRAEAGCPVQHLSMGNQDNIPPYGDLSRDPNINSHPPTSIPITNTSTFAPSNMQDVSSDFSTASFLYNSNSSKFELPNRQRSPASNQGSSSMHRSPQSYNMDMSPDHSSGENQTPNSSTQSQSQSHSQQNNLSAHTSHTGYSPQNLHQDQPTPGRLTSNALFAPNDGTFSTDFDMTSFPVSAADSQSGFVLPSNWGSNSTGLTPGATGMTPGATGMSMGAMGDMMGMTQAEWDSMMENMTFQDWSGAGGAGVESTMMPQGRQM